MGEFDLSRARRAVWDSDEFLTWRVIDFLVVLLFEELLKKSFGSLELIDMELVEPAGVRDLKFIDLFRKLDFESIFEPSSISCGKAHEQNVASERK